MTLKDPNDLDIYRDDIIEWPSNYLGLGVLYCTPNTSSFGDLQWCDEKIAWSGKQTVAVSKTRLGRGDKSCEVLTMFTSFTWPSKGRYGLFRQNPNGNGTHIIPKHSHCNRKGKENNGKKITKYLFSFMVMNAQVPSWTRISTRKCTCLCCQGFNGVWWPKRPCSGHHEIMKTEFVGVPENHVNIWHLTLFHSSMTNTFCFGTSWFPA